VNNRNDWKERAKTYPMTAVHFDVLRAIADGVEMKLTRRRIAIERTLAAKGFVEYADGKWTVTETGRAELARREARDAGE
jgi:ABC-type branched-subunit amino acid transport system substrate-binding protein